MDIVLKLDPAEAEVDAVRRGLIEFNRNALGRPAGFQPFALLLNHPDTGEPVGGLTGMALFDWVYVELLHVPADLRGHGYGRKLMAEAEDFARARGLVGIWLDTFAFQARGFYEKLGFAVFGTIPEHPRGSERYFLRKYL